jgi:hypothetical protein
MTKWIEWLPVIVFTGFLGAVCALVFALEAGDARDFDARADVIERRERACVAVVECRTWLASCFATQRHESTCVDRAARLGFVPGVRP